MITAADGTINNTDRQLIMQRLRTDWNLKKIFNFDHSKKQKMIFFFFVFFQKLTGIKQRKNCLKKQWQFVFLLFKMFKKKKYYDIYGMYSK